MICIDFILFMLRQKLELRKWWNLWRCCFQTFQIISYCVRPCSVRPGMRPVPAGWTWPGSKQGGTWMGRSFRPGLEWKLGRFAFFSHFLAWNGSTSKLLRIGSKAGTELRQGLSETMGFTWSASGMVPGLYRFQSGWTRPKSSILHPSLTVY